MSTDIDFEEFSKEEADRLGIEEADSDYMDELVEALREDEDGSK